MNKEEIAKRKRKDVVAVLNAQEVANKPRSATIVVDGVTVACYETGEIEKLDMRTGEITRTFGCVNGRGYRVARIGRKTPRVHRVIYAAFNGGIDSGMQVDHIDGDKQNNSISNLRQLTNLQNCRAFRSIKIGTSSKYRGVRWYSRYNKWEARITIKGGGKWLGYFACEDEAGLAYNAAAIQYGFEKESLNIIT